MLYRSGKRMSMAYKHVMSCQERRRRHVGRLTRVSGTGVRTSPRSHLTRLPRASSASNTGAGSVFRKGRLRSTCMNGSCRDQLPGLMQVRCMPLSNTALPATRSHVRNALKRCWPPSAETRAPHKQLIGRQLDCKYGCLRSVGAAQQYAFTGSALRLRA